MSERKVYVEIHGVGYNLITDESEEQIKEMAEYVEGKIDEVKKMRLSYDKELVLTSLNIANDLFNVGNKLRAFRESSGEAIEKYPDLVEKYRLAIKQNEELIAKVEEVIGQNEAYEKELADLKQRVKANENSDKSVDKLRSEIKRLQQEVITLRSENDSLKENI